MKANALFSEPRQPLWICSNPQLNDTKSVKLEIVYIHQTLLSKATYSALRLYILSVCVFTGNWPTTFCIANAMLYHWATGTQHNLLIKALLVSLWFTVVERVLKKHTQVKVPLLSRKCVSRVKVLVQKMTRVREKSSLFKSTHEFE